MAFQKGHKTNKGRTPWNKGKKTGLVPKTAFKKGHTSWIKGIKGLGKPNSGSFKKGMVPWNKNKKGMKYLNRKNPPSFSKEHRRKMRERTGEKAANWQGGISNKEIVAGRKRPEQCEICGGMGKIDFDHDHKTNKFRGWICRRCNLALGMVKDNSELLIALSQYLKDNDKTKI